MKAAFNLEYVLNDDEWKSFWLKSDVLGEITDESDEESDGESDFTSEFDNDNNSSTLQQFADSIYAETNDLPINGHLFCAAHTLQLAINNSIKSCESTQQFLKYVNRIMSFFKRSTRWRLELTKKCNDAPKVFAATRWNSNLHMLNRFKQVCNQYFTFQSKTDRQPRLLVCFYTNTNNLHLYYQY